MDSLRFDGRTAIVTGAGGNPSLGRAHALMLTYARESLPPELVSPVVAFLAHEDCPVTGECVEAVGGQVRRVQITQTEGIADRDLTLEKLAERWDELFADSSSSVIPHGAMDPTQWDIKPYCPAERV